jgi:hypothetical protein
LEASSEAALWTLSTISRPKGRTGLWIGEVWARALKEAMVARVAMKEDLFMFVRVLRFRFVSFTAFELLYAPRVPSFEWVRVQQGLEEWDERDACIQTWMYNAGRRADCTAMRMQWGACGCVESNEISCSNAYYLELKTYQGSTLLQTLTSPPEMQRVGGESLSTLPSLALERPRWFAPKPISTYEVWISTNKWKDFGVLRDPRTGRIFVYGQSL